MFGANKVYYGNVEMANVKDLKRLACGVEQAEISQGKEEIPTKMGPQPITKIPDAYKSNF